jgi:hemoglobin-like flavoprotein
MTPEQKALVQTSFAQVAPIADQAASIFYDDLFERAPELRSMFAADMAEQRRKLMAMLAVAVANLDAWETIAPAVRDLGKRHVSYGVQPDHYPIVGAALIATLGKGLGPAFTPEIKEAWIACFNAVAAEMQAGVAN